MYNWKSKQSTGDEMDQPDRGDGRRRRGPGQARGGGNWSDEYRGGGRPAYRGRGSGPGRGEWEERPSYRGRGGGRGSERGWVDRGHGRPFRGRGNRGGWVERGANRPFRGSGRGSGSDRGSDGDNSSEMHRADSISSFTSDLAEQFESMSVSSSSEAATTYSTTETEEEVLSVDSSERDPLFKMSGSQLDLLSQGEVDPFAPIEYAKAPLERLVPANRTGLEKVKLLSNIFPIRTDPNRDVYRYDVTADLVLAGEQRGSGVVSLNRGPKDDTLMIRRSEAIRLALKQALEAYRILNETGVTVFDGSTILFSNENLAVALKPHNGTLTIPVGHLSPNIRSILVSGEAREVRITIRPCVDEAHHFTIGDAEKKIADGESDRALRQFYELLTNEGAMKKGSYIFYGAGKAFLKEDRAKVDNIGHGHERRQGMTKGIRFIEGEEYKEDKDPDSRLVAALVLDAKVGTFYKANGLIETIAQLNKWSGPNEVSWDAASIKRTNSYLRGLRLEVINSRTSFICAGLDYRDEQMRITFRTLLDCEEPITPRAKRLISSIEKYEKQGIRIQFPRWPVVVQRAPKAGRKDFYFPIELLSVAPNQRVPLTKFMTNPEKARKPDDRWSLIKAHLEELDLGVSKTSPILAGFGITVDTKPLEVTGFKRPAPKVQYGDTTSFCATDPKKAGWRQGSAQYTEGAVIEKLYIAWTGNPKLLPQIKDFSEKFSSEAAQRGLTICSMEVEENPLNLESEVRSANLFARAKAQRRELGSKAIIMIVYISSRYMDSSCRVLETKSHGLLKFLESKHQIVTQHLATETVLGRKSYDGTVKAMDASTMENILAKTNLKAFGLNYTIQPEEFAKNHWFGSTLVIGYDVCHPTGQTVGERALGYSQENPSVVGFAHNACATRDAFAGDFAYQEPNREKVDDRLLNLRIKWILKHWQKKREEKLPETIFIFRDGVSEGQYDMVLHEELAAILEACDEYENGYRPYFVLVIVTKRHNKRFFKEESNGAIGNPEPLTVIDQEVVRTDLTELFMQTHHAIQGTAKPTQYILLHSSDPTVTQDNFQALTVALTFQHQICSMPVSIPEPVYQSDEWAKRGSELLKTYRDLRFQLPRKGGDGKSDNKDRKIPVDWEEMTKRLAYIGKPLDGQRSNA